MLPQEKFVFEILYKGDYLGENPWGKTEYYEKAMKDCGLIYRKGKDMKDLRNAFWGYESLFQHSKGYDIFSEWCLERLDKVLTIDWVQMYRRM